MGFDFALELLCLFFMWRPNNNAAAAILPESPPQKQGEIVILRVHTPRRWHSFVDSMRNHVLPFLLFPPLPSFI